MPPIVGPGIRARMDEVGDSPVTHEWTEKHGNSIQAKAYGRQGLYVASQDSGQWVTVGPLPKEVGD